MQAQVDNYQPTAEELSRVLPAAIRQRLASDQQLADVLGPQALTTGSAAQPAGLRLLAERRRLEQTRRADFDPEALVDCAPILAELLSHWPNEVNIEADSISVTPQLITAHAHVPTMDDADKVAQALKRMPKWRLEPPQSQARGNKVEVTLRLRPQPEDT